MDFLKIILSKKKRLKTTHILYESVLQHSGEGKNKRTEIRPKFVMGASRVRMLTLKRYWRSFEGNKIVLYLVVVVMFDKIHCIIYLKRVNFIYKFYFNKFKLNK